MNQIKLPPKIHVSIEMPTSPEFSVNPAIDFKNNDSLAIILSFDYKILAINDVALSIHGWESKDVLNKDYLVLCRAQNVEVPLEQYVDRIKEGEDIRTEQKIVINNWGQDAKYKNQTHFSYRFRPYFNADNKIEGLLVLSTRQSTHTELAKGATTIVQLHEPPLRQLAPPITPAPGFIAAVVTIMEALVGDSEAVFAADEKRKIRHCNKAFAKYFHHSSSKGVLGHSISELSNEANLHVLHGRIQEVLEKQSGEAVKVQFLQKNREILEVNLLFHLDEHQKPWVLGSMVTQKDVSIQPVIRYELDKNSTPSLVGKSEKGPASSQERFSKARGATISHQNDTGEFSELNIIREKYGLPPITKPFLEGESEVYTMTNEEHLFAMPASIYYMDTNGFYLGGNALALDLAGMDSVKQLRGKTVFDMAKINDWPDGLAQRFYEEDMLVISSGKPSYQLYDTISRGHRASPLTQIAIKEPIVNAARKVIGLRGVAISIDSSARVIGKAKDLLKI